VTCVAVPADELEPIELAGAAGAPPDPRRTTRWWEWLAVVAVSLPGGGYAYRLLLPDDAPERRVNRS